MREQIIKALISHAKGHIDKHVANVEVHIQNATGVAEHSDHVETIEKELAIIAKYEEQVDLIKKYFIS